MGLIKSSEFKGFRKNLREVLGLKTYRSRSGLMLRDVVSEIEYQVKSRKMLPVAADTMAWGLSWFVHTGRLPYEVERQILSMSPHSVTGLVAELAVNCDTIADIGPYLVKHLSK